MNLPNKLTVLRIVLTPVFMCSLLLQFPHHFLVALLLFIFASVTDFIDGKLARKYNQVTNFGKFLDPLADKMLITAALLGFMVLNIGYGTVWITFIVMFREFLISSLRLAAVSNGKVIAANAFGKIKTVSQMVAIIFGILAAYVLSLPALQALPEFYSIGFALDMITNVLLWFSAFMTLISGAVYLKQNFKFVNFSK